MTATSCATVATGNLHNVIKIEENNNKYIFYDVDKLAINLR